MNITSVILKEKLRFIEISARKLHLSAVILGLKVKFLKIKVLDFIIRLSISMTTVLSLINAPGALQFFKRGMSIRGKFSMQKCSV